MLFTIFMILFVIVSFLLVVVILLQSSKGDGLSGALGGGGMMAQNVVGVRQAANVLQKATIVLGLAFAVLAIVISMTIGGQNAEGTQSILQERAAETQNQSQLPVFESSGNETTPSATPA